MSRSVRQRNGSKRGASQLYLRRLEQPLARYDTVVEWPLWTVPQAHLIHAVSMNRYQMFELKGTLNF